MKNWKCDRLLVGAERILNPLVGPLVEVGGIPEDG
jgi:hypothetical protein